MKSERFIEENVETNTGVAMEGCTRSPMTHNCLVVSTPVLIVVISTPILIHLTSAPWAMHTTSVGINIVCCRQTTILDSVTFLLHFLFDSFIQVT